MESGSCDIINGPFGELANERRKVGGTAKDTVLFVLQYPIFAIF